MTPYYEADGITILCGDCRDVLPLVDGASMVLTDPPYGDTSLEWDRRVKDWLRLLPLSPQGSVWFYASLRLLLAMAADGEFLDWRFAQDVIWEKHNGSGLHADRFKRVHEQVVQLYHQTSEWSEVFNVP